MPDNNDPSPATHWSKVWLAANGSGREQMAALEFLCKTYWFPIYSFARKSGLNPQDAEDLTQGFFSKLLEHNTFAAADPSRGSLRKFLFFLVRRYLRSEWKRANSQKRGGGVEHVRLQDAELRYSRSLVDEKTPDRVFQMNWALGLIEKALEATSRDAARMKKPELFVLFRSRLGLNFRTTESARAIETPEAPMTPGQRVGLHRMEKRFNQHFIREVAQTIERNDPKEIMAEVQELREIL